MFFYRFVKEVAYIINILQTIRIFAISLLFNAAYGLTLDPLLHSCKARIFISELLLALPLATTLNSLVCIVSYQIS